MVHDELHYNLLGFYILATEIYILTYLLVKWHRGKE